MVSKENIPLNPAKGGDDSKCCLPLSQTIWIARVAFLLFFMVDYLMISYVSEYVLYRTARNYNDSRYDTLREQEQICSNISRESENDTETSTWSTIQEEATQTLLFMNIAELLPTFPIVLIMGTWSDVSGKRKPMLWLPTLGNLCYTIALVSDYYLKIQNKGVLYLGAFFSGISGGQAMFYSGGASLISDGSSKEERTKGLVILETCGAIAMGSSSIINGYSIVHGGFQGPAWLMFSASVVALIACFMIKEPESSSQNKCCASDYIIQIKNTAKMCSDSSQVSVILLLYILSFGIYTFIHTGQERTNVLFLETTPLCLDIILIGWWIFAQGAVMACGVFILPRFESSCLTDVVMAYIGFLSRAAGTLCLIFTTNMYIAFAGKIILII